MRAHSTGLEFEHIDISHQLHNDQPVIVSVRKNLWQSLTDMISSSNQKFTLFPRYREIPSLVKGYIMNCLVVTDGYIYR